jgi:hypothetical protein
MPVRVVEVLKAIHVQHDERHRQAVAFGPPQFEVEGLQEEPPIIETGLKQAEFEYEGVSTTWRCP